MFYLIPVIFIFHNFSWLIFGLSLWVLFSSLFSLPLIFLICLIDPYPLVSVDKHTLWSVYPSFAIFSDISLCLSHYLPPLPLTIFVLNSLFLSLCLCFIFFFSPQDVQWHIEDQTLFGVTCMLLYLFVFLNHKYNCIFSLDVKVWLMPGS